MVDEKKSIGVATMSEDGAIHLFLRAEGPKGLRGDAAFTYEKFDPEYQNVLQHIGGITVGEEKPVPPWT